VTLPLAN